MRTTLLALNLLVSLAAAAFAVTALFKPEQLSHSVEVTAGERYHARMFAIRSIPFQFAVGILPFLAWHEVSVAFLVVAAAIQAADAVLGWQFGIRSEIIGGSVAAIVHAGTATLV